MERRDDGDVFDTAGAGRFLGLAKSTMERMRIEGGGPVFAKLGGVIRYCRSDLEAYRDARKYGSTSEYGRAKPSPPPISPKARSDGRSDAM